MHGTQETNLSFSYIQRDGAQSFEAFTYFGFRYLQIDNPGEALGRNQLVAIARHADMPAVPMATFSSDDRMLDAVWRLMARSCLYCSQEQFVDTPTREKGQFAWDAANESEGIMRAYGDQNISWQALRDVARGQARYWPDGQVNAVYPNGDGARFFGTFDGALPRMGVALLPLDGRQGHGAAPLRLDRQGGGLAVVGPPGRHRPALRAGRQSNGDPVYGYDLSVAADTASNVLAVNAFNRVAQLAGVAGDAGGAALWQARATQLAASINAALRRPDGVYVDGVTPTVRRARAASQEANALGLGLRRRAGRRREGGRRLRGRHRHPPRPEPRPRAAAGAGGGRTCPTPWCTR